MQTMGKYTLCLLAIGTQMISEWNYVQTKMAADLMIDCLQQCEDLLSYVRTFCHEMEGAGNDW